MSEGYTLKAPVPDPINNPVERLAVMATSLDQLEMFIYDYEIRHTVKFCVCSTSGAFNKNYLPWKDPKREVDRIMRWQSAGKVMVDIPYSGAPYTTVGSKNYNCMFGKKKNGHVSTCDPGSTRNTESRKIGCPAHVHIQEIIRWLKPKPPVITNSTTMLSKNGRRIMGAKFRDEMIRLRAGEKPDPNFAWQREFHMTIFPLNSHNHVIGEAAGPHMIPDSRIKARITALAKSGILELELIRENIAHYVENELFKGKPPPAKTNLRFYPGVKVIYNHSRAKVAVKCGRRPGRPRKKDLAEIEQHEEALEAAAHAVVQDDETDDAVVELIAAVEECESENVGQAFVSPQHSHDYPEIFTPPKQPPALSHHKSPPRQYSYSARTHQTLFTDHSQKQRNNVQLPLDDSDDGNVSDGSDGMSISSRQTYASQASNSSLGYKSRSHLRKHPSLKTAKQRFMDLVEKLVKIANLVENNSSYTKLSASLVNVIMSAKPLIPKQSFEKIYAVEPQVLLHPRRIRQKPQVKKKRILPTRIPPSNPDFVKPPDNKTFKAEQTRRRNELKKLWEAEKLKKKQEGEHSYQKKHVTFSSPDKNKASSEARGDKPQNVVNSSCLKKSPLPASACNDSKSLVVATPLNKPRSEIKPSEAATVRPNKLTTSGAQNKPCPNQMMTRAKTKAENKQHPDLGSKSPSKTIAGCKRAAPTLTPSCVNESKHPKVIVPNLKYRPLIPKPDNSSATATTSGAKNSIIAATTSDAVQLHLPKAFAYKAPGPDKKLDEASAVTDVLTFISAFGLDQSYTDGTPIFLIQSSDADPKSPAKETQKK